VERLSSFGRDPVKFLKALRSVIEAFLCGGRCSWFGGGDISLVAVYGHLLWRVLKILHRNGLEFSSSIEGTWSGLVLDGKSFLTDALQFSKSILLIQSLVP